MLWLAVLMHATAISNSPNQCIVLEKQEIFKINITQYKHGAAKRFRLWQNSNEKSVVFNKEKRLCLRINTKTNHSTTFAFSFQMHRIHHKCEKEQKKCAKSSTHRWNLWTNCWSSGIQNHCKWCTWCLRIVSLCCFQPATLTCVAMVYNYCVNCS